MGECDPQKNSDHKPLIEDIIAAALVIDSINKEHPG
jgi:hypothetical protein